jgi:hypothetical protein
MQKAVKTMLALTAVLAAKAVQAVSFPIGTYVYAGTLNRYDNRAMTAEDEMTIEAVSTNGNILAVATVTDPDGEGVNFRLEVPVATSATATAAAVGDAPVCVVRSRQGVRAAASEKFPPVLCASAVTNCSIRYAKSMEFPYSGEEKVCIPEDYLANIAALMDEYGHSEYSANADWDGDGQDNYREFMAGTNPFDAGDGASWKKVDGLGASYGAMALLPVKPGAGKGAALEYELEAKEGEDALVLQFLPDFRLFPGEKLRVSVSVNGAEPFEVEVPGSNGREDEKGETRRYAVQDGFVRAAKKGVLKAGNNSVKVLALDAGVVLDKVGVR